MRKSKLCRTLCAVLAFVAAAVPAVSASAQEIPYKGYSYDYWQTEVPTPSAYEPERSVTGRDMGTEALNNPTDLYIHTDGTIYLCDSGNSRILVLNRDLTVKRIIESFEGEAGRDQFKNPQGICVEKNGSLYVADTGNHRIVKLSAADELELIIDAPENEDSLPDNFVFEPIKLGVDPAGKVYVIAKNIFEGMLNFSPEGKYLGYFGTIKVTVGLADRFWRMFSTKEQRDKMKLFVPTEFTGLDIDENGFVYTTDVDYTSVRSIKKFNPGSVDILRNYNVKTDDAKELKLSDLIGDYRFLNNGMYAGRSSLTDVEYRQKGIFSVLDNKRGRILTYDNEGNILYIFGGMGSELGMFKKPVALEAYEDRIYILDADRGAVVVFAATKYGNLINQAIGLRYDGDEGEAVACWEEVLKLDANCRLAYVGIGKSLLAKNENREAMFYLKKGMDKINYSVAFKRYRTDVMKQYFPYAAAAAAVLAAVWVTVRIRKRIKAKADA